MNCKACGREFWTRAYYVTSGKRKFCGLKCSTSGEKNGNYKASTKTWYDRKKESIARHPEKHRCHQRFEYAMRRGKIQRKPCQTCGEQKSEAHHHDYTKPYDVIWLCREHHVHEHKGRPED